MTSSRSWPPASFQSPTGVLKLDGEGVGITKMLHRRATLKRPSSQVSKNSGVPRSNLSGFLEILKSPLNLLLIFVPLGLLANYCPLDSWGEKKDMIVFWLNFIAMVPLANMLGDATEELAANLKNDMISGLLNATFGNAVELIMSLAFIFSGQYEVLKASMVGSVLSNLLLVLGMSFFFGGIRKQKQLVQEQDPKTRTLLNVEEYTMTMANREQHFNGVGALVNSTLLLVACAMIGLVSVFHETTKGTGDGGPAEVLYMSRYASILIIITYFAYLVFQLFTHQQLLGDDDDEKEQEDEEEPALDLKCSLFLLVLVTLIVAFSSEALSGSLENALKGTPLTEQFTGVILIPIIGNACEHVSAIRFAWDNRAGLAVGIAVGSSVQIALFAVPFTVLAGWMIHPGEVMNNMDLNFGMLHVCVLFISTIVVLSIILDGKSNWLAGWLLMTTYMIAAGLYFFVGTDEKEA